MSNLIPQFAKKKITTEYWLRVITAWFFLWGSALLVATVLLFPVYIFTNVQINVNSEAAATAEASVESYESVAFDLEKATLQSRYIIEDSRRNKAHQYLDLIVTNEGTGIEINQISFSQGAQGLQPLIINGQAENRESLAALRDRLLAEEVVAQADLPISNLARDRDIDFTISVTLVNGARL
jgi:hypothetical protein